MVSSVRAILSLVFFVFFRKDNKTTQWSSFFFFACLLVCLFVWKKECMNVEMYKRKMDYLTCAVSVDCHVEM